MNDGHTVPATECEREGVLTVLAIATDGYRDSHRVAADGPVRWGVYRVVPTRVRYDEYGITAPYPHWQEDVAVINNGTLRTPDQWVRAWLAASLARSAEVGVLSATPDGAVRRVPLGADQYTLHTLAVEWPDMPDGIDRVPDADIVRLLWGVGSRSAA